VRGSRLFSNSVTYHVDYVSESLPYENDKFIAAYGYTTATMDKFPHLEWDKSSVMLLIMTSTTIGQ